MRNEKMSAVYKWIKYCEGQKLSCDAPKKQIVSQIESYFMVLDIHPSDYRHKAHTCHIKRLYECANYSYEENPVVEYLDKAKSNQRISDVFGDGNTTTDIDTNSSDEDSETGTEDEVDEHVDASNNTSCDGIEYQVRKLVNHS
eukprot:NODE_24_length_36516_cov_0.652470.p18 type:complete len:143 gc:universal NODE_24_length_36516_cov_0.652470:5772-5344(-)